MRSGGFSRSQALEGYAFTLPALLLVLGLILYPIALSVYLSFFNQNLLRPGLGRFLGLGNYARLLSDSKTLNAFQKSAAMVGFGALGTMLVGFLLGLFLNIGFRGSTVLISVLLIPWVLPEIVTGQIWRWIFQGDVGVANAILHRLGLIREPILWLGSVELAMPTIIGAVIWRLSPFTTLMFLGALRSVPPELLEAASIDGANGFQRFRHITLPHLRYVTVIGTLLVAIFILNNFAVVWVSTKGGPVNATEIIPVLIYKMNFQNYATSRAAALS
ncbi:MAG: sugar ABC transporter permease, partial [Deinococcus sp.]|nr:sugar ABC transporter permease [Deinococcus sp.]